MLAYGRCCSSECQRGFYERRRWNWDGGFLSWIPGRINDDSHAQPHSIRVVEVQAKPQRHMFASSHAHVVDFGGNYFGQHPTNVDSHHWFLEALLQLL